MPPLTEDKTPLALHNHFGHPRQMGKLTVYETVLGRGSFGTVVYKGDADIVASERCDVLSPIRVHNCCSHVRPRAGAYEGHEVAVKRMLKDYTEIAAHEVSLLRRSDKHPHVIR